MCQFRNICELYLAGNIKETTGITTLEFKVQIMFIDINSGDITYKIYKNL